MRISPVARAAVAILSALIGFLVVSQVRGRVEDRDLLETASEADLTRILASLNQETADLRDEIATLRLQLQAIESATAQGGAAAAAAAAQQRALEVLAGTVAVTGPGVRIDIADTVDAVTAEVFIDIAQELRDAGAEAIAIDGHRLGVQSAFEQTPDGVTLDGVTLSRRVHVIEAIGDAVTLDGGLSIPGGVKDTLAAARGVQVRIERAQKLHLPALASAASFEVARPVASEP